MAKRSQIEIFYTPKNAPKNLEIIVDDKFYGDSYSPADRKTTDDFWEKLLAESKKNKTPEPTSPRVRATLDSVDKDGRVYCRTTDFRDYVAISRIPEKLSEKARDGMRVAAVAAYLLTNDGYILVHKRSTKATHSPGYLDSSCAGLCTVEKGKINPVKDIEGKLKAELGIEMKDVQEVKFTGVHSCAAPDFSGMFTYGLVTKLTNKEVEERVNKAMKEGKGGRLDSYELVKRDDLVKYLVDHYLVKKDMVADGLTTLMGALTNEEYEALLKKVKGSGIETRVGLLKDGVCVERGKG